MRPFNLKEYIKNPNIPILTQMLLIIVIKII